MKVEIVIFNRYNNANDYDYDAYDYLFLYFRLRSRAELKPKNKIYKKQSDSSESISRRNDGDNQFPLLTKHDESYDDQNGSGYLEPIQQFPIPSTPITATNRHMSNIRTNPHMRLTQV